MPAYFCLTVRFLQPYSHGRGDGGDPEWPPSPLRVFQALVAAAAATWNERLRVEYAAPALRWLERQPPPEVVAAAGVPSGVPYRLYVPDNVADKVAKSWSGGREASIADYRTEKDVRPTHHRGEAVHYVYPAADAEFEQHRGALQTAARSITHVGWGVDVVAADNRVIDEAEAAGLAGERWRPADEAAVASLRVPVAGTLDDLTRKHTAFLGRLDGDRFNPVPPLTAYRVVGYRRATDPAPLLAYTPFRILSADPDATPPSFDAPRRARDVACWVRHAAGRVCDPADAVTFVHGHDPDDPARPARGPTADDRLLFLPLPTLNPALNHRAEAIRRVLVAGPAGSADRVRQVGRRLEGADLMWEDEVFGVLAPLPASDWVLRQYTTASPVWSTVTPVLLPGHDDRNPRKAWGLLKTAFRQAGLPAELVDDPRTELDWRAVGYRPGVGLARQYQPPAGLDNRPRFHVRVRFPVAVRGPLAVGAGRYRGMGVFAAEGAG